MTIETLAGSANQCSHRSARSPARVTRRLAPRASRGGSSMRAHAVEQIFEQLAVGGDDVGEQADEQHLEADDHQHRGGDQRLQVWPQPVNDVK